MRRINKSVVMSAVLVLVLFALLISQNSRAQQMIPSQPSTPTTPQTPDIPHLISYQGLLTDGTGLPVTDGQHIVTVRFYSDANGTSPAAWEDSFNVTTTGGIFSLLLGSQNPLPAEMSATWLSAALDNGPEMKPFSQVAAAPYAMTVANGAITTEKMGTDFIGSISLNGERVTTRGGNLNLITGDGISAMFDSTSNSLLLGGTGTGMTTLSSDNYIINETTQESGANFNISGSGVIGTNLTVGGIVTFQNLTSGSSDTNVVVSNGGVLHTRSISSLNGGGVMSITGTANQVYASSPNGNVTLSLPQNINTGATPTFSDVTLNSLPTNSSATNVVVSNGGSLETRSVESIATPSWSLTGNSGTTSGTNFIGTTNPQNLMIKVNGQQSGKVEFNPNTANTSLGYQALISNTPGINQTGISNSAFGWRSLYSNTTGSSNTASGGVTLTFNTTGSANTATGSGVMQSNTTGSQNTANGWGSLPSNIGGSYNTAIGALSLWSNTSGNYNSANGHQSLYNTTGDSNTAFGNNSGITNTTGSSNTFIGANADASSNNLSNATAIGANASVAQSNSLVLGSINGVNGATASTNVGIGTTSPAQTLDIAGRVRIENLPTNTDDNLVTSNTSGDLTVRSASALVSSNAWGLNGNSGTTPGTNFIGTTDNEDLVFRTNNIEVLSITAAAGLQSNLYSVALGISNTASVSYSTVSGGVSNSAIGYGSTVGGGTGNQANSFLSTVAGGAGNVAIGASFIGGGQSNQIHEFGASSVIGGGENNTVHADADVFVGGGDYNLCEGGAIVGGIGNHTFGPSSFIGAGDSNIAGFDAGRYYSVVVGGRHNTAIAQSPFIGGGENNTANGNFSVITGGLNNTAVANNAFIGAGEIDTVTGDHGVIVGGRNNKAAGLVSAIVGGENNYAIADGTFIGGGDGNYALIQSSSVVGGEYNRDSAFRAVITGGSSNTVYGTSAFIGAGDFNTIDRNPGNGSADYAVIVGGYANYDDGPESFIGSGDHNIVDGGSDGFIGAGYGNYIRGQASAIVAGDSNRNTDGENYAFIGGGHKNTVSGFGVVGGGSNNTAGGTTSVVVGGENNFTNAYSAIPGGRNLAVSTNSFGFNGDTSSAQTQLSYPFEHNLAYFGNVDLWLGNVDGTARGLRFYAPNTTYDYSGANYTSFQAQSQSANVTYTLPASQGAANTVLTNDGSGNLSWVATMTNWVAVPASSSASGNPGDKAYDSNYLYICVSANTWERVALSSW